jgi:hypothetical protein
MKATLTAGPRAGETACRASPGGGWSRATYQNGSPVAARCADHGAEIIAPALV